MLGNTNIKYADCNSLPGERVTPYAPQMRSADSGFSEAYMEYGEEKTQASVTKQRP